MVLLGGGRRIGPSRAEEPILRPRACFPAQRHLLPSIWVAVARDAADLGSLATDERWSALSGTGEGRVWTDDYANVAGAVIWGGADRE